MISVDTNERISTLVERALQTDDNKLETVRGLSSNVVGNLGDVGVIECGIDLIQNEERGRLVTSQVCRCQWSPLIHHGIERTYELRTEERGQPQSSHHQKVAPYPGNVSWEAWRGI